MREALRLNEGRDASDHDVLDSILAVDTDQAADKRRWVIVALSAIAATILCITLTIIREVSRADVHVIVKLVHMTDDGTVEDRGTVAMADYTPADWQWIGMLRQWVLMLRWRGLDVRQAHLAWEWLKWHSCGEAVAQLQRYYAIEEPFQDIGVRKREVLNIVVTKGDIDGLWTVLWQEVYVDGAQPAKHERQSVSFAVARKKVTREMEQANGFGLCVKKLGGLNP